MQKKPWKADVKIAFVYWRQKQFVLLQTPWYYYVVGEGSREINPSFNAVENSPKRYCFHYSRPVFKIAKRVIFKNQKNISDRDDFVNFQPISQTKFGEYQS